MPMPPVTIVDRIGAIGGASMMACFIFGIGFFLHRAISKDSPTKRIQGRPIVWWVTALMFLGSCYGAWMADNQRYYLHEVVGGMGGFGLLAGLCVGNIHGFIDLWRSRNNRDGLSAGADMTGNVSSEDDGNPYSPPRSL
jgi:hypothetical protein